MMENYIDNIRAVNKNFVKLIDGLSIDQLNKIPDGFNNNIVWNFAHLLAVQQAIFYNLSGVMPKIDPAFIATYKSSTKPEKIVDETELEEIKQTFAKAIDTFEEDYNRGIFTNFKTYETSFGATLNSIDDAIHFSTIHDGLHYGYSRALQKLI